MAAARDPVTLAIAATTLVALGLRAYHLSRPGFLFGVTEYDDGPYFGSAVRLTQGILPYRDFVLVQPPGITLLMLPAAALAKLTGTAWGLAAGRILTALAGAAGVVLMGLLVRHRGAFATLVACGILAVFPDSVAAAHTVLVEPWLVLFCLAGAVAVFDRDRLADGRRLAWGGVAFGFAGAVEGWAIVPVFVLLVLCLAGPAPSWFRTRPSRARRARTRQSRTRQSRTRQSRTRQSRARRARARRAAVFVGAVAAGFCVPVLPFVIAAPRGFYKSLVIAQIGPRTGAVRVPLVDRLYEMTGLSDIHLPAHINLLVTQFYLGLSTLVWITAAIIGVLAVGVPAALNFVTREPPAALEWFALVTTELVVVMFLWPSQFHYHFAAFLAPFLGLAIALPAAKLVTLRRAPNDRVRGDQPPAVPGEQTPGVPGDHAGPRTPADQARGNQAPAVPGDHAPGDHGPGGPGEQTPGVPGDQAGPRTPGDHVRGNQAPAVPGDHGPGDHGPGGPGEQTPGVPGGQVGHKTVGRRAAGVAVAVAAALVAFTIIEVHNESRGSPVVGPSAIAAARRVIPPGACVVSDNVNLLLLADRFVSGMPGCGVIDDGLGTDLALSHGLTPATGAGEVPAVARVWWQAFGHAQFVWFSDHSWRRIAWSPPLLSYFRRVFRPILTDQFGDTLYKRRND